MRLTVCERSATQKCINLPNSFFSLARVRKEDRPRSDYEVFTFPQQYTATPPHGPFRAQYLHTMWHKFISL